MAETRFVAHLARLLPADADVADVRAARAADLHLACACADGDATAIAAFEERYFGEIDAAAARMRAARDEAVEVKQTLRRILFVDEPQRPAAVRRFAGRGDLRGWIRVAAVRQLQRLLGKRRREVPVGDEGLLDFLSPGNDPEQSYLREQYRRELAAAVAAAMDATPPLERAVLGYQVVDGLSIDEIGALYDVHRATAARWLSKARDGILARTRDELSRRLGAPAVEVDSIIRLVSSRLDVSLERLLG